MKPIKARCPICNRYLRRINYVLTEKGKQAVVAIKARRETGR
jgi:hypothetical protein